MNEQRDWQPGERVIVIVTPERNEVVEFWLSRIGYGAEVVATKAQHHGFGSVSYDYGPHEKGSEYYVVLLPTRDSQRAWPQ